MTKSKCIDFVNHMLDKCGHDATRLVKLMPKCLWSKEECSALEAYLVGRIPSTALPGGPAGAPAAAFIAKKVTQKSPGGGDAVFGWCDTLYGMAKTRYFEKLKHPKPAPGMDPLPAETGDVHTDRRVMNKWMEKNIGGAPAAELTHAEKIWHKMKQVGKTVKHASGWDHFEPERETAKKMAKGVSGYDHFKKQKDEKEAKEAKEKDEKEAKENEEEK